MKNFRFARTGAEVFERQAELNGEEFRLYCFVLFHTFLDTLICQLSLRQIAERYGLDYDNLTRRYKILREKGWCENTEQGIRPLVGFSGE